MSDLLDVVGDKEPELLPRQLLPGHSLGWGRRRRSDQARFGAEDGRVVTGGTGGRHTEIIIIKHCRMLTITAN